MAGPEWTAGGTPTLASRPSIPAPCPGPAVPTLGRRRASGDPLPRQSWGAGSHGGGTHGRGAPRRRRGRSGYGAMAPPTLASRSTSTQKCMSHPFHYV